MTLKDYLAREGNSASKLAGACGVAVSTITRAAEGTTVPSRELIEAIFKHTGGAVSPNDFFKLETAKAA